MILRDWLGVKHQWTIQAGKDLDTLEVQTNGRRVIGSDKTLHEYATFWAYRFYKATDRQIDRWLSFYVQSTAKVISGQLMSLHKTKRWKLSHYFKILSSPIFTYFFVLVKRISVRVSILYASLKGIHAENVLIVMVPCSHKMCWYNLWRLLIQLRVCCSFS